MSISQLAMLKMYANIRAIVDTNVAIALVRQLYQ